MLKQVHFMIMIKNSRRGKALQLAVERGYKISKQGTVTNPKGRIILGCLTPLGYNCTTIRDGADGFQLAFHQLQAYTKYGDEIFEAECIRHLDGNSENNSWYNIAIGSMKENTSDNSKEKLRLKIDAATEVNRALNNKQSRDIIDLYNNGVSIRFLQLKYSVSKSTIYRIINGKTKCYIEAEM